MSRRIANDTWLQFKQLLPHNRRPNEPVLPTNLAYQGQISGPFAYVLPDRILDSIRAWLAERGESIVFYFITETVSGQDADFALDVSELRSVNLSSLNPGGENVLTGQNFAWALFLDHEGALHVAGPKALFDAVSRVVSTRDDFD